MIADQPAPPPAFHVAARPAVPRGAGLPLRWRRDLDTPAAGRLRWTPDGKWLAFVPVDRPQVVSFIDAAGGDAPPFEVGPREVLGPAPRARRDFALSADGRLLAFPLPGGTVQLWNLASHGLERELVGTGEEVRTLAFDPAGQWLVTGGEAYGMALWEVASGKLLRKHPQPNRQQGGQVRLAFSTDRHWLVGVGEDHELSMWKMPTLALSTALDAFPALTFETDGRLVAYRDRNGLRLWDLQTGERTAAGPYWEVAVQPGGRRVLARSEGGRLVWIEVGTRRTRPTGLTFSLPAEAAFSPDGQTLAIARGSSRGIRLYDVRP